ncbi:hypothetical protein V8D89_005498 [Ganoderma adspersum]
MLLCRLCLVPFAIGATLAWPMAQRAAPSVKLDDGTFVGDSDGDVDKFLGIPFAKPPTGNLRFNLPVAAGPYSGTHTVTEFGPACPQQAFQHSISGGLPKEVTDFIPDGIYQDVGLSAEDCLSINVVVPAGTKSGTKLPVVVWIYGCGFEVGGTRTYDGGAIVKRSIELNEPVVYVSMNYRVSAFGFLASKEVKDAGVGNLGLQDRDPSKVTIWGESAGAISVGLHLLANGGDTEGLFHGAFMQSGAPIPVGDITNGQADYDSLVAATGCSGASDTLQCLRKVHFNKLKAAVDKTPNVFSYQSLHQTWLPRADGVLLTDAPQNLVQQGKIANVPFVIGNCDDEGTLYSLSTLNLTTRSDLENYIKENYLPGAADSDIDTVLRVYPDNPSQGSPFDTGFKNLLSAQYKRIAAIQGDLIFQAPRQFFLEHTAGKQPTWSFLSKRFKSTRYLWSAQGADVSVVYSGGDMTAYLVHFVNKLDPNGQGATPWPKYTLDSRKVLAFQDSTFFPVTVIKDDYRVEGFNILTKLSLQSPM